MTLVRATLRAIDPDKLNKNMCADKYCSPPHSKNLQRNPKQFLFEIHWVPGESTVDKTKRADPSPLGPLEQSDLEKYAKVHLEPIEKVGDGWEHHCRGAGTC